MKILIILILAVCFVVVFRFLGAWMLRINDVIDELQAIKHELKKNATEQRVDKDR